jgi:predicted heme/steroid binding protein
MNTVLSVPAPGVLGNDEDADGDELAAVLESGPAHGALKLSADGGFVYTPTVGFAGQDGFTYRAYDGQAYSEAAAVSLAVEEVANQPPLAQADAYTTTMNTVLSVPAPGVLGNDEDADGDELTAVLESGPAHGALKLSADGGFVYTPTVGYTGQDGFSYRAYDGQAYSQAAAVSLVVEPGLQFHIYLPMLAKPAAIQPGALFRLGSLKVIPR